MTYPTPNVNYSAVVGTSSTAPFITIIQNRAPTSSDGPTQNYLVGQRWIDTGDHNSEWFLLTFSTIGGYKQAVWAQIGAGSMTTETLTGNDAIPVPSSAGNINVVGDLASGVGFTGNAITSTLTATLAAIPNTSLANNAITLVAGTGISITTSPVALGGSTTISATGSGVAWVNVTSSPQILAADTGYVPNTGAALVIFTLPSIAVLGDTYIIQGFSSGGWQVNVGTGQVINLGDTPTTITTGTIASTNGFDSVTITCVIPNTTFCCRAVQGNITVT